MNRRELLMSTAAAAAVTALGLPAAAGVLPAFEAVAEVLPATETAAAPETFEMEVGYGLLPIMAVVKGREDLLNIRALRISVHERRLLNGIIQTLETAPVGKEHAEELDMIGYLDREGYIEVIDPDTYAGYPEHGWRTERFTIPA